MRGNGCANDVVRHLSYKDVCIPFVFSARLDCYEKSVTSMSKSMPATRAKQLTQTLRPQGRPKKKPDYDADAILSALMDAVTDSYLSPSDDEEVEGHKPIKLVAEEFEITPLKVRKLLITGGVYRTAISKRVLDLHREGKTIEQIQKVVGLGRASIHSYLPYMKGVYRHVESARAPIITRVRVKQKRMFLATLFTLLFPVTRSKEAIGART